MSESIELSNLDKVLLENVALVEENAALHNELAKMQIEQKKAQLKNHLVSRYKIDLSKNTFEVDGKTGKLNIKPRENVQDTVRS